MAWDDFFAPGGGNWIPGSKFGAASAERLRNNFALLKRFQYTGTGSPEGVVTAPVGSVYTRSDGSADSTVYVKESGAGNTGWVALETPKVRIAEVAVTSPELLALRATPKQLVAAPGAGKIAQFLSAALLLDATATAYVESTANLGIKYTDGAGIQVSETIETTGFIDQVVDTMTTARPKLDPIVAKAGCENQPLMLHNLGAGEFTTGTGTLRVKTAYLVWSSGW